MSKPKGPTFADAHASFNKHQDARSVEHREYRTLVGGSQHGSSWIYIVCPFCEAHVKAYLWSLAGGGKRCECGALFGGRGVGYHWEKQE